MPDYYVARINYGKPYFDDLREELIAGRYRQGWGNSGCNLRTNTAQTFPYGKIRYDMLSLMLDIKPGDRIIIPKVSVNAQCDSTNFFTIVVCTALYSFAPFLPKYDDYGHIIEVDVKGSWIRYHEPRNSVEKAAQYIMKFIGNFDYGKFDIAINVVDNNYCEECFKKAVEYLIDPVKNLAPDKYPHIEPYDRDRNGAATQDDDNSNTSYRKEYDIMPTLEDLIESNLEQHRKFWQGVLNILQTLQPDDVLKAARSVCAEILEEIVVNLFKNNGFNRVEDDNYLIFERNTIEDTIYDMNGVDIPKIYVLIEKSGVGYAKAFAQLEAINTRVFISLTEKFSDDIKTSAKEDHIMLINGQQFAELVIKYASKFNS